MDYIYEPWTAPINVQKKANCIIGKDYPAPIVNHEVVSNRNANEMKRIKTELIESLKEVSFLNHYFLLTHFYCFFYTQILLIFYLGTKSYQTIKCSRNKGIFGTHLRSAFSHGLMILQPSCAYILLLHKM